MKRLVMTMTLAMSRQAFGICEHEYRRWQNYKKEAENWAKACAPVAVVGGCFLGPLGGLISAGPAAAAARYDKMAQDAHQDYEDCIARGGKSWDQIHQENQERQQREAERRERERRERENQHRRNEENRRMEQEKERAKKDKKDDLEKEGF